MNPASSIPPEGGQDWQGTYKLWRYPLATKSPIVRSRTPSSSPSSSLILLPGPGDTDRESGTSGWREGVTTLPLLVLVPVPGCLPRERTHNLPPYTAGRPKIYPCHHLRDRAQIFGRTGNPTFGALPSRGTLPNRV